MLLSKNLLISFFPQFKNVSEANFNKYFNSVGIEVESTHFFENTNNLVVAKIIDVKKHPNSEKLNLCKVQFQKKIFDVVCGANNVEKNALIIFALPGCKMIDGRVIETKEILGFKSNGMICSYSELTKRNMFLDGDSKDEIIILDNNAEIYDNKPLKYIGFDDVVFDLSIPSNRPELNSIIGIAYELFPFLNLKISNDLLPIRSINKKDLVIESENISFFSIFKIDTSKQKKSSWKIKSFLMNSGIKLDSPIDNLCNLVTLLTGNLIKIFNSNLFAGNKIKIINLKRKEDISLGPNKNYLVDKNNFIYKTKNNIFSINGILFNEPKSNEEDDHFDKYISIFSTCNNSLKNINFNLNIDENSSNFAKATPLFFSLKANEIILNLFKSANIKVNSFNYEAGKHTPQFVSYDHNRVISLLGMKISQDKIKLILKQLNFSLSKNKILIPSYRNDILDINDIVEEILKLLNINECKPQPILDTTISIENNDWFKIDTIIKDYFLNRGFFILKTYNLTSIDANFKFNLFNSKENIKILNPISNDKEVLRNNLIEKHLLILFENNSYKNNLFPTFEVQTVYVNKNKEMHICGLIPNNFFENKIANSCIENNLFSMKSLLIDLFLKFSISLDFDYYDFLNNLIFLNKNNTISVLYNKEVIGYIGQINFLFLQRNDFHKPVFFFEVNINKFLNLKNENDLKVKYTDNRHLIVRELSILVKHKNFRDLENVINSNKDINNFKVNDVYKIDENEVSYNISFIFKQEEKQVTNEDINLKFNNLINLLERNNFYIRKNISK